MSLTSSNQRFLKNKQILRQMKIVKSGIKIIENKKNPFSKCLLLIILLQLAIQTISWSQDYINLINSNNAPGRLHCGSPLPCVTSYPRRYQKSVYLRLNGKKNPIPNEQTYFRLFDSWDIVAEIFPCILDRFETGPVIDLNIELVRNERNEVYLINHSQRFPIPTFEYHQSKYMKKPRTVNQCDLSQYSVAEPFTLSWY